MRNFKRDELLPLKRSEFSGPAEVEKREYPVRLRQLRMLAIMVLALISALGCGIELVIMIGF